MPRTMPNSGKVLSWSELDVNKRENYDFRNTWVPWQVSESEGPRVCSKGSPPAPDTQSQGFTPDLPKMRPPEQR